MRSKLNRLGHVRPGEGEGVEGFGCSPVQGAGSMWPETLPYRTFVGDREIFYIRNNWGVRYVKI